MTIPNRSSLPSGQHTKKENAYPEQQAQVSEIIDGIRGIRNARAEMDIPPSKKAKVYIQCDKENEPIYRGNEDIFIKMASASEVEITETENDLENALNIVTNTAKFTIPLDDLIDKEKEMQRLEKEKQKIGKEIARFKRQIGQS